MLKPTYNAALPTIVGECEFFKQDVGFMTSFTNFSHPGHWYCLRNALSTMLHEEVYQKIYPEIMKDPRGIYF